MDRGEATNGLVRLTEELDVDLRGLRAHPERPSNTGSEQVWLGKELASSSMTAGSRRVENPVQGSLGQPERGGGGVGVPGCLGAHPLRNILEGRQEAPSSGQAGTEVLGTVG